MQRHFDYGSPAEEYIWLYIHAVGYSQLCNVAGDQPRCVVNEITSVGLMTAFMAPFCL